MIDPTPRVEFVTGSASAGTTATTTYPAGLSGPAAHVDSLEVSWGRTRYTDHHDAQTARFGLLVPDPATAATLATYDWLGRVVLLKWDAADAAGPVTRTFFRGRISEYEVKPRPPHPRTRASRGCVITFTAAGVLTDLGNRVSGVESWPDETFSARVARIRTIAGPTVASIATRPFFDGAPVAARAVNRTDALSLLKTMYDSAGGNRLAYDPHTNAVSWVGRRAVPIMAVGSRHRAGLYNDPEFGQGIAPRVIQPTNKYPALDGRWVQWDGDAPLRQTIEQRVTRVEYAWAEAGVSKSNYVYDPAAEADRGIIALSVSTEFRQANWAEQCGRDWLDSVWREGSRLQPPPLTYRADRAGGFPSMAHAQLMIGGAELVMGQSSGGSESAVYVMSTPWAALNSAPVFGVIGGLIRYSSAGWAPTLHLQAVWHDDISEYEPVKIRDLTIPGATPYRFPIGELSRGVTFADLRRLGPRR